MAKFIEVTSRLTGLNVCIAVDVVAFFEASKEEDDTPRCVIHSKVGFSI